jgi:carbamoyltransferase
MNGSYLGPESFEAEIFRMINRYKAVYKKMDSFDELALQTSRLLAEGNVVGWLQGRMEFGPRALGNRSILGDARNKDMQAKMNLKIKYRESFRPFAPAVLAEDASSFFDLSVPSPYMSLVADVVPSRRNNLAAISGSLPLQGRLQQVRSDVPAITHIDYSARVQTVHKETNERFWKLLHAFKKLSGDGILVNTSFNVRGEPIVCTAEDSYRCFMRTEMDYLVINDYLFSKNDQPEWKETPDKWKNDFQPD